MYSSLYVIRIPQTIYMPNQRAWLISEKYWKDSFSQFVVYWVFDWFSAASWNSIPNLQRINCVLSRTIDKQINQQRQRQQKKKKNCVRANMFVNWVWAHSVVEILEFLNTWNWREQWMKRRMKKWRRRRKRKPWIVNRSKEKEKNT